MNANDLSWLTAKQKRLKTWRDFAERETQDPILGRQILHILELYAGKLFDIWEAKACTDSDKFAIDDLERQLEQLNEEARMRVVPKESRNA